MRCNGAQVSRHCGYSGGQELRTDCPVEFGEIANLRGAFFYCVYIGSVHVPAPVHVCVCLGEEEGER